MRLPRFAAGSSLTEALPDARPDDRMGHAHGLSGSWSATRWQYTSRARPEVAVDVVCDLGGTVTLSLSEGAYVLTWDVPGSASGSAGGVLAMSDGRLNLTAQGAGEAESVRVHVAGPTLALSCEGSAWDFDGSGEESAGFVAVLVRL